MKHTNKQIDYLPYKFHPVPLFFEFDGENP
jgi:hypothetical protein